MQLILFADGRMLQTATLPSLDRYVHVGLHPDDPVHFIQSNASLTLAGHDDVAYRKLRVIKELSNCDVHLDGIVGHGMHNLFPTHGAKQGKFGLNLGAR